MTIVVGTNFSPAAEAAVDWAASEAEQTDDDLVIAHSCVVPLAIYGEHGINPRSHMLDIPRLIVAAGNVVDASVARVVARHPGVRVEKLIGRSEAGRLLVDASHSARLLVVGTHSQNRLSTLLMGSTTRFVLNHATAAVAVVPTTAITPSNQRIGRVLVGVDGSPGAARALEWAAGEAIARNAALRALYVSDADRADVAAQTELSTALADLSKTRVGGENLQISSDLIHGPIAKALLREAHDDDLLVVGSRGRGGMRSTLLGSVAHQVVTNAPCAVVVVRPSPQSLPTAGSSASGNGR
jgi:nucleotide-binding universal stress UspA family protein